MAPRSPVLLPPVSSPADRSSSSPVSACRSRCLPGARAAGVLAAKPACSGGLLSDLLGSASGSGSRGRFPERRGCCDRRWMGCDEGQSRGLLQGLRECLPGGPVELQGTETAMVLDFFVGLAVAMWMKVLLLE